MDMMQSGALLDVYQDPVGQLLHLGRSPDERGEEWHDYQARFGLGPQHVPELIRLACDPSVHDSDPDGVACWGPVHAWRALGQIRAEQAVEPLLALKKARDFDDLMDEELPAVFGMIGPPAISPITAFLSDSSLDTFVAATAMTGLKEIASRYPECRASCVGILAGVLDPARQSDRSTNGLAISLLIDLMAVEAIDAMRAAMRQDRVDLSIAGDEEDVEIELGLREHRTTPKPTPYLRISDNWVRRDIDKTPRGGATVHNHVVQEPIRVVKIGRNEPCPCGSGKKYKKCCLT